MKQVKRKSIIVMTVGILLAGCIGSAVYTLKTGRSPLETAVGTKPFKDLEAAKLASAAVRLIPPDMTIRLPETETLAGYLRDVVIYQKDDSYTEYAGQGVTYTLTMTDGTQTTVMAYNPFLVIDGVGYRTKYQPCEALNGYANRLLQEKDVVFILEEPPVLDVVSDETCCSVLPGSYSWQCENGDGTVTGGEADGPHPLDCEGQLPVLETTETTATLRFGQDPDEVTACRWSRAHWGDTAAADETVSVRGNEMTLEAGGWIYEVSARWDTDRSGCGGVAYYAFYVEVAE